MNFCPSSRFMAPSLSPSPSFPSFLSLSSFLFSLSLPCRIPFINSFPFPSCLFQDLLLFITFLPFLSRIFLFPFLSLASLLFIRVISLIIPFLPLSSCLFSVPFHLARFPSLHHCLISFIPPFPLLPYYARPLPFIAFVSLPFCPPPFHCIPSCPPSLHCPPSLVPLLAGLFRMAPPCPAFGLGIDL